MNAQRVIVVGVDGTEGSRLALRWALQEAAYRGDTVHTVATWHWEGFDESALETSGPQVAHDISQTRLDEEVAKTLAEWTDAPPPVTSEVVEGAPAEVLVAASADADMLVLGSHGHSKLRHRAVGSTSAHIIENARCPVVVVPLSRE